MNLMSPVSETLATSLLEPEANRADHLFAGAAVADEMLADAARALDLAATLPLDSRAGMYCQARMRMNGAALLLDELNRKGEDFVAISAEIADAAMTSDPERVRNIAARLQAAVDIELHQMQLGMLYDRYA